jgi:hypothetical protein
MTDVKRGPGRPKGAKSKHTKELAKQVAATAKAIESIIPDAFAGDAHALLMALYKDPRKEITIRLDAAKAAAPYEKPKLASTELKSDTENPLKHKLVIEFVRAPEKPIPE